MKQVDDLMIGTFFQSKVEHANQFHGIGKPIQRITNKSKKESGNCPYCSSPNCKLGFKDFFKTYSKPKTNEPNKR